MKKIRKYLLLVLFLLCLGILNSPVTAAEEITTADNASYKVDEVAVEKELGYGVNYHRDIAATRLNAAGYSVGSAAGSGGGGTLEVNKWYPQQVNVLEINDYETTKVVPYANLVGDTWSKESVRNSAIDYENKNPGWKVVAAINGDFFNTGISSGSTGVTVSEGEFYKATCNHGGNILGISGISVSDVTVSGVVPTLTIYDNENNVILHTKIDKVNSSPSENETSVYYCQRQENWGSLFTEQLIPTGAWYVKNGEAAVTVVRNSFYGIGKISYRTTEEVTMENKPSGNEPEFAILSNNSEINELLGVDVKIRVQYEFVDESLKEYESFVGYPMGIFKNRQYTGDDSSFVKTRHPRTMIGVKEDGSLVMAVIDGRQPGLDRYGATLYELSALMQYYGCVDAWNLDGGGSSTLIIRKQENWFLPNDYVSNNTSNFHVTNSPSDGGERNDGNCLLVVTKVPTFEINYKATADGEISLVISTISSLDMYKDLYIEINGEKKKITEDEQIAFSGLEEATYYRYVIYHKLPDTEQYLSLMITGYVQTSKNKPSLRSLFYNIENNDIVLTCQCDNAGAIKKYGIIIDGEEQIVTKGKFTLESNLAASVELQEKTIIRIYYDVSDGNGEQYVDYEYSDVKTSILSTLLMLDCIVSEYHNGLFEIAK